MKYKSLISIVFLCIITSFGIAQTNSITIGGGYVLTNLEDLDVSSTGFRINGLYEYNMLDGHLSHGFAFGYVQTNATVQNKVTEQEAELRSVHWPFYYSPKYSFLDPDGVFNLYITGALGFHLSNYTKTGTYNDDFYFGDGGFYGGLGAGIAIRASDLVFFNLQYEFAYLSNSGYSYGFLNSFDLGIGFNF